MFFGRLTANLNYVFNDRTSSIMLGYTYADVSKDGLFPASHIKSIIRSLRNSCCACGVMRILPVSFMEHRWELEFCFEVLHIDKSLVGTRVF